MKDSVLFFIVALVNHSWSIIILQHTDNEFVLNIAKITVLKITQRNTVKMQYERS